MIWLFFFLTQTFSSFTTRTSWSAGLRVLGRGGKGQGRLCVISFHCNLPPVVSAWVRCPVARLFSQGAFFGGLVDDSALAGYLAPTFPLKWASTPLAWPTDFQRKAPFSAFWFIPLLYFMWFCRAEPPSRRSGPAPFSKPSSGLSKMHIHPCPVRLSEGRPLPLQPCLFLQLPASCDSWDKF